MAKNVATLALGAGAATAYLRPDLVAGAAFDAAFGPLQRLQTQTSSNNDTEALKQMVRSPALRVHGVVLRTCTGRGAEGRCCIQEGALGANYLRQAPSLPGRWSNCPGI